MESIHGGDIYTYHPKFDFSANINPFPIPSSISLAAVQGIERMRHYPDVRQRLLKEAVAEAEQVPDSWLIFGNGAAELIFTYLSCLRPNEVLLPVPSFLEYANACRAYGSRIRPFYLNEAEQFFLTERILPAITEEIKLIILCNPNNPTGRVISAELLERIIERCENKGCNLLLDECFLDFVGEGSGTVSGKAYLKKSRRIFLVRAMTKMYAMAGLRLGYAVCSDEVLLLKMKRQLQPWNVSTPAQLAGAAAIKETAFVEETRERIREEREFLYDGLEMLGIPYIKSEANFILWKGREGLFSELLARGILIRDCGNYEGLCAGYYRTAVRARKENEALLTALKECLLQQDAHNS